MDNPRKSDDYRMEVLTYFALSNMGNAEYCIRVRPGVLHSGKATPVHGPCSLGILVILSIRAEISIVYHFQIRMFHPMLVSVVGAAFEG